ncbi:MAG: polysaccharide pyruvyl transferase family protein, partial [Nocardiopsaceae bacterium]|nr:polysaccharide pyruvyl transferase family protein [Nocardiopsaceae bacterium]
MDAVAAELAAAGIARDLAWSPVLCPGGLTLDAVDPGDYTHLVFACGPLSGPGIAGLHERFRGCRRIAIGVSVPDPAADAAVGFHAVLPRDGPGIAPAGDLSIAPLSLELPRERERESLGIPSIRDRPPGRYSQSGQSGQSGQLDQDVPVAGVIMVARQAEYGDRGRHEEVAADLDDWLRGCGCARIPLDTRLDPQDWRLPRDPDELAAIVSRLDLVVTMRLHGLVLALARCVPVIAVDPVAGGAKVSAQARAWRWPARLEPGPDGRLDPAALDRWRDW